MIEEHFWCDLNLQISIGFFFSSILFLFHKLLKKSFLTSDMHPSCCECHIEIG